MEEDGDLNQKPRAKTTLEESPNNKAQESLVSIHENVLSFLVSSNILMSQPVEETGNENHKETGNSLQALRQKRIYLATEIASIRSQSALSTIKEDPGQNKNIAIQTSSFLEETASSLEALWESEEVADNNESNQQSSANLAVSMQRIRNKRKLDAAYRLGGITAAVPQSDPELLSIRFDICLDGEYVACYHAFFDLIIMAVEANKKKNNKDGEEDNLDEQAIIDNNQAAADTSSPSESRLFLRLVQHTIPSSIPLQDICQKTLGGSLFQLGDLHHTVDWRTQEFQTRLRSWCRQCYRACWCLARRKQAWNFLERLRQQSLNDKANDQIVNSLTTSATDSLDQITFQLSLHLQSATTSEQDHNVLDVQLRYGDLMNSQPTQANVKAIPRSMLPSSGSSQQQECALSDVSGDEQGDTDRIQELAKKAQKAFLELPIDQALEQLKGNHKCSALS